MPIKSEGSLFRPSVFVPQRLEPQLFELALSSQDLMLEVLLGPL